ncbi:MAG TPA: hypothetical protein VGG69_03390 [Rhizomicrobium sp.]
MSRLSILLAAAAVAAVVVPASAAEPPTNAFGLAVAPQGGKASLHQWGGLDDNFAVNPDGAAAPVPAPHGAAAMAQSQDDSNDPDDPDTAHDDDVYAI